MFFGQKCPCIIAVALLLVLGSAPARGAIGLTPVVSGLNDPLLAISAHDGSGRLFIVQQTGQIFIYANGALNSTPFLDISQLVVSGGELGLLGLAFHPSFSGNGQFYVNYTRNGSGGLETVIAQYQVSSGNGNAADPSSARILLTFSQPFDNHKGGMMDFGNDGFLYISTGDGGSGGDPMGNAQNTNVLLGKILRIDVNSGNPYGIPPDNPFVRGGGRAEIFAYGFRNPWRFSFDRPTGRLFVADVGENTREEIDIVTKGGNYGWNLMEGTICFPPGSSCNMAGLTLPIYDYGHDLGSAVIGGYVYHGSAMPWLQGKYLYTDLSGGRIWALIQQSDGTWVNETLLSGDGLTVGSMGQDEAGELYVVDYGNGAVLQVVNDGSTPSVSTGGLVNAASFLGGPVSPGELVAIFGNNMGPSSGASGYLDSSGRVTSTLEESQVFFNGVAAPLLYTSAGQVNAQVPYEVGGNANVSMTVQFQGNVSDATTVAVGDAAPGLFTLAAGLGQGAILNQDLSANSASNPATRGSVAVFYATGSGQTTPAGVDGQLAAAPLPAPVLPVTVSIGGVSADIVFAAPAPTFAGLMQINARVPQTAATGGAVPVVIHIGDAAIQPGVTMAVR